MGEPKLDPVNALPLSGKVEPYPIYRAEVNYPEEARQLHLEGIVRVKLTVNCDGLPNDVRVADGPRVGHGLEEEAVNNVVVGDLDPHRRTGNVFRQLPGRCEFSNHQLASDHSQLKLMEDLDFPSRHPLR